LAVDTHRPRLPGWRERLEAEPARERFFRETYDRLRALVEHMPEVRRLVHSDLLHYNVLVDGDRITAIIDWGSALFGDFVYDVAWLAFWSPWYPAWSSIDFAEEAARHYAAIGLEVPAYEVRLRGCQLHIGQDALAYQAFTGRWDEFDWTAERLRSVAAGE
jgi:hygromycin-B 4-O-kinase